MLGLGALTFATPAALWALAALPVIWWLLRFIPPRPARVKFPPFRLLLDLLAREEQPDRTPWWLVALRLALATLVILAVARPLISEDSATGLTGDRLLVVVDDGWASAPAWPARQKALLALIDTAERAGAPVALAVTTPEARPSNLEFRPAAEVRERAAALSPRALETARADRLKDIAQRVGSQGPLQVVWLADGLESGTAQAFAAGLRRLAGGRAQVRVLTPDPDKLPPALAQPKLEEGKLNVVARRASTGKAGEAVVRIEATNGRSLGESRLAFQPGSDRAAGSIELPVELRNEAARVKIADERSAGAVYLFDDRWRRKTVGLVSGASLELDQPLLSPLYYVSRALEPSAELRRPQSGPRGTAELLKQGLSMLVLADVGVVPREDRDRIAKWVEDGGVLLRFAGPRLAGGNDDLVPVELRTGGRSLGSALSWEEPQALAAFPETGPFAGLTLDPTVKVSRQVLAEPTPDLQPKVWASLTDGTPLVTAAKRGNGLVVLMHVTANADWSNLPLSGMFVEMLNRIVELAPGTGEQEAAGTARAADAQEAWLPRYALNGFGELTSPSSEASPIAAAAMDKAKPAPASPAGLYERAGATRALNLVAGEAGLKPMGTLPQGVARAGYETAPAVDLAGPFFAAALILFLIDCIAALFLSGAVSRLRTRRVAATLLAGLLAAAPSGDGLLRAQDNQQAANEFALKSVLDTHLAYVITGDREVDDVSLAGLSGLNEVLIQRTAVEPAEPMGIDIEKDEIVFFPLLYWPVLPNAQVPSAQTLAKIDTFMKNGGTIFFDTRDYQSDFSGAAGEPGPATLALRRILENLDVPALEPVPPEHVITKAFYLLQAFPGRYAGGKLWVEAAQAAGEAQRDDGVSSIIIGSNDYAAAWAIGTDRQPLFAAVPEGERQREFAYRTGVNIVMYALTGNYKADQVHVPAILERLGQ